MSMLYYLSGCLESCNQSVILCDERMFGLLSVIAWDSKSQSHQEGMSAVHRASSLEPWCEIPARSLANSSSSYIN